MNENLALWLEHFINLISLAVSRGLSWPRTRSWAARSWRLWSENTARRAGRRAGSVSQPAGRTVGQRDRLRRGWSSSSRASSWSRATSSRRRWWWPLVGRSTRGSALLGRLVSINNRHSSQATSFGNNFQLFSDEWSLRLRASVIHHDPARRS